MQNFVRAITFLAALFPCQAAVNLALVAKPGMPTEPVFLLTEALSKLPDVNLLERAELDRIIRERALSATSAKDVLQGARILGADGVLFLEASGAATNQVINARLAVVNKGAIIHANRAPLSSAWTATILREFGPSIPKTVIPPDRAIKLSVLNLRSPGNAAVSEALDRELTSLLLLRLSAEPEVLVLERRKLADLSFEKELAQGSEQFWTGSHLIDGTVNPTGIQPNIVDLKVRLQTPGSPAQQIVLRGARTNLTGLIDQLTIKLLEKLNATARKQWDPASEASQHLDEAEWALRWKMYEEAQAAADSAWALGLQTPQSAAARSLAYARAALAPDRQWIHNMGPSLFESFATVDPPPQREELQALRVGLAVTENALEQNPLWLTNQQWNSAVNAALEAAGETLAHYYWCPKFAKNEDLPEVRQMARSILNSDINNPENRRRFWFETNAPSAAELDAYYKGPNVFQSAATYSGLFNETPEDAVAMYRRLVSGSAFPYVREFIFGRHPQQPRLPAWRGKDGGPVKKLWTGFVSELLTSTNAMLRIEGKFFNLELLPDLPALQKEVFAFLNATMTDTNGLSLYAVPPRFRESIYNLDNSRTWPNDKVGSGEVTLINNTRESFEGLDGRYSFLKAQAARAVLEKRFKEHIAAHKPYDSQLFAAHLLGIGNREQARAATNDLVNYLVMITNTPNALDGRAAAEVAGQFAALEKAIARRTGLEVMKETQERQKALMARARTNKTVRTPEPARAVDTNTFVIRLAQDDFWQFQSEDISASMSPLDAYAPIYRDGKLWFFTKEYFWRENKAGDARSGSFRPVIASVDPSTLKTNMYSAASKADEYYAGDLMVQIKADERQFSFEAIDPFVFVADGSRLRRLDTRTRKWSELALPVANGVLYRVSDRLILSAESGIFELSDHGERSRVLASARRRPAVTRLDSLETFGKTPAILPGPDGSVRALIHGNAYRFERDDWKAETHFTNLTPAIRGEWILFYGGPNSELHLLTPTNSAPVFVGTGPLRGATGGVSASPTRAQALFDVPEQFSGDRVYMVLDGYAAIWESWAKSENNTVPANLMMTVFDPAQARPLRLPVAFDMRLPKTPGIGGNFLLSRLWMAQSEAGFLLGIPGFNGFWKISRGDLDRAFAQARREAGNRP
jgi:hypothetical protein